MAGVLVWARFLIILGWIAVTVASVTTFPTITEARDQAGVDGFVPADSATTATEIRSFEEFGFPLLSRTAIVQRNPEGLLPDVQAEAVRRAAEVTGKAYPDIPLVLGALPVPNTLQLFPGSQESGTTVITYLFTPPWAGFAEQYDAAEQLVARSTGPQDAVVGVTGSIPARVEQGRIVIESLPLIEAATVVAILLITALVFRSVVAPLVALLVAGVALLVTTRAAPLAADAVGLTVPSELEPLYVALVLGVVTDYVIFFLSAMQRALPETGDRLVAARRATADVAPIVTVAGLTVAAGTGALLVARSDLFRAFGPGMALAVLVSMVVSVTLTPALLAVLGRVAFWPRRLAPAVPVRLGRARGAAPSLLIRALSRRLPALVVLAACVAGLGYAARPVQDLRLGLSFVPSLPASSSVAAASTAAQAGFAPGIVSPTEVLVTGDALVRERVALGRLGRLLQEQPGVAGVVGPGYIPTALDAQGVVLSRSGNAARYLLVLDDEPLGASAIATVSRLRAGSARLAEEAGLSGVQVGFGGDTSLAEEVVQRTTDDLALICLAALLANLVMLAVFLRALVAPVFLLACSVLALVASLGVATYVFQELLGYDGLTFYVPFAAAVLLVALGSDYNIFGVGQVWEEARRRPLREAIRLAMPQSTRAITAAGVILAASFGLLALVPLRPFRELAFTMSLGILLDVLIVRSLLVPALLTLLGGLSGWPGAQLAQRRAR